MELLFGLALTLTAAVVGVWHVASRDRPLHGPVDDGTLGLPHLQRWSEMRPKRRFGRVREALPLIDGGRVLLVIGGLVLLAGLGLGGTFAWRWLTAGDDVGSDDIGSIVTLHARANASSDAATRYALLTEAEEAAAAALEAAKPEQVATIEAEYQSIRNDLDRMTRMVRLESIQGVGSIPPPPEGVMPQLFQGGGRTYLLADALYEVDVAGAQLIRLLGPGDEVAGATVGPLLSGTWRGDAPLVVDAERAYSFDQTRGEWDWEALGKIDDQVVTQGVGAVGVFDLNLYMLDRAVGRVLKFTGGDYESEPEDWAPGLATEELKLATDIYVDGNIHVLLPNGTILRFYLSRLDGMLTPKIQPAFDSASALVPVSNGFYIVNSSDGRIARISSDGQLIQQYSGLDPDVLVEGLQDLVVDENTGIALMLTEDALYTTRLVASDG